MTRLPFDPHSTVVLLVLLLPISSAAQEHPSGSLRLQIHFHNYADAPPWMLREAVSIARGAYRGANIEIDWLDCTPALPGLPAPSACHDQPRPTSLVVQLASNKMARQTSIAKRIFGYALPSLPGRFSTRASLFYERIQDYSEAHGLDSNVLLGMALAHEIGHLLLGRDSHDARGLMSCPWDKADIVNAARGRLAFTSRQTERIRASVFARAEAERAAEQVKAD